MKFCCSPARIKELIKEIKGREWCFSVVLFSLILEILD